MSDSLSPLPQDNNDSFRNRAYAASPLGVAAIVIGLVLAIVFLIRFHTILGHTHNSDLHSAIQALEIAVEAVWVGFILWGWYLVKDGMERAHTNRRLNTQASTLFRIEKSLAQMDNVKHEIAEKGRSFWQRRSGN